MQSYSASRSNRKIVQNELKAVGSQLGLFKNETMSDFTYEIVDATSKWTGAYRSSHMPSS